jgi:hypothetical protein
MGDSPMNRILLRCAVGALVLSAPALAAGQKTQTVTLSEPGIVTASVHFGSVRIGAEKTATVTLANATSEPIFVGLHLTEFPAGSGFAAESFCGAVDGLQPGETCTVQVSMTGEEPGHYKGRVVLTTFMSCAETPEGCPNGGSPDVVITLSGTTRPG